MRERKSEILNDFIPEYFEGLEDDEIEKIKKHNEGVREQLKELRDKWEFEEIGAEKYFTLALGREWTGGDVFDDFC